MLVDYSSIHPPAPPPAAARAAGYYCCYDCRMCHCHVHPLSHANGIVLGKLKKTTTGLSKTDGPEFLLLRCSSCCICLLHRPRYARTLRGMKISKKLKEVYTDRKKTERPPRCIPVYIKSHAHERILEEYFFSDPRQKHEANDKIEN